ncbi:MAG: WYL domain-containing protein [Eubacterium sp.]|nr:WYL domain-containing protein [Eubacterium sp.]
MAKSEKQKMKLLALLEILKEFTDEEHGISMSEIISQLEQREIHAERKSIYSDITLLNDNGYEIEKSKEKGNVNYCLLNRDFELPELKLLVDAVQASKFISEKKSNELIKKIEALASKYQARALQRQVYVANRVKTNYESVYYNIDDINQAINSNSRISFDYYEWTLEKTMELRENGKKSAISPWALMWDDENYYMVAFDGESETIKHYRVDKMRRITLENIPRDGKENFEKFDMAVYAKKVFNMFTGNEQVVKLEFKKRMIGVVMDRFGKDVIIMPGEGDTFVVNVKVSVSNMFFGWIIGLGDGVKILGPDPVLEQFGQKMEQIRNQYC